MKLNHIPKLRLFSQKIIYSDLNSAEDVVAHFGAMQSQDFAGAKYAVGLRMKKSVEQDIDDAFNSGRILRTHILRPTWHSVHPSDIRWMEELSKPQVMQMMKYYEKQLEIDETLYKKSYEVFEKVLQKKNFLTRDQLAEELAKHNIKASGQRLGHLIFYAELSGLICSGPRIGKQFSYALIDDLVPIQKSISREEALEKLLIRFFNSRGAATLKDFAKWSGINLTEIKNYTQELGKRFPKAEIEGEIYFLSPLLSDAPFPAAPYVVLLPNYDEYASSYADYSAIYYPIENKQNLDKDSNPIFWNHLIIDGIITGSWRRGVKGKTIEMQTAPFRDLTKSEKVATEKAAEAYGKFFGMNIKLL